MHWWIWALIGLLLLAIEFASTTMRIGLFAIGAAVVAILVGSGLDVPLWGQLLIFTAVSLAALLFLRPVLVRRLRLEEGKAVDSLVGEQAVALEDISVGGSGRAEMRGTTWTARNIGETVLIRGQRCVVARVEGLIIHIRAS